VLGSFLVAGLAIWTAILSPAPPKPAPGGGTPRATTAAAVPNQLPADHPKVPLALPDEVKTFIADLTKKATENPQDTALWSRLGQVEYRASQLDTTHYPAALAAFRHALELDPKHVDAIRGMANVHYDREEHKDAIPYYERYLALRPDDLSARTDLGTMYLYGGDPARAIATYRDVIQRDPKFLQAHYNLAVTQHQQGDDGAALAEFRAAHELATDDGARKQIDGMIAELSGEASPKDAPSASASAEDTTPFQTAVEKALRAHQIVGPRITRFEWSGPGAGRVLVANFPMEGMPPVAREKFASRLSSILRDAGSASVGGTVTLEIVDAVSGTVMATATP
jgi:tetratricopeptide (TPR) repeat protein